MIRLYNRAKAVEYAEKWWNGRNPAFPSFEVDCTNFISQCLLAGGIQMRGYPNRASGWWMMNSSWSFSWAVAHSMRWFLPSIATQVSDVNQLELGDVICYDFSGDGRVDHTTIITAISNGIPLVNAHTNDSRMRNWAYRDSAAYTPNIRYYFFHIS